jgi:3-oxoacyl-[acyl-carrier protein] reductase
MLRLDGQVAWVTGASRGIGFACARLLQQCGARVAALDIEPGSAPGEFASYTQLDVSDSQAVNAAAEKLAGEGLAPDILVNNAGITRDGVLWKLSDEDWSSVLRVNLDGAFYLTRAAAPHMRENGSGAIVNITSINGERGKFGQCNYSASKAGLIGLTRASARELGRFGVRVNAVAPGMIESEMTAEVPAEARENAIRESLLGRIGSPDDIARAVLYLCSPLASHVTGQVLRVDGGQYL